MYKEYFLMQTEPFAPFPSPHLFYKSQGHEKAWKNLVYCLKRKEPVVMTAGEYGTGKTLLCLKLIQFMEKNRVAPMVYIPSPGYSFPMLLEKIARKLGLPVDGTNPEESQRFIYEYFENDPPEKNKYVYIVVDDIQEFDHAFISELTKLITYNNFGYFPLRLFMFGHSGFLKSLDERNFVSFKQRIKSVALRPLGVAEVTEYIYFRLISSGASGSPVFNEQAVELITLASKGLPRLINKICDSSLLMAYKKRANFIDRSIVEMALEDTGIATEASFVQKPPPLAATAAPASPQLTQPVSRRVVTDTPKPPEPTPAGQAADGQMSDEQMPSGQFPAESMTRRSRGEDLFKAPENQQKRTKRKKQKPKDIRKGAWVDGKTLMIACLLMIIVLMLMFVFSGRGVSGIGQAGADPQNSVITRAVPESGTGKYGKSLVTKPVIRKERETKTGRIPPMMDARLNGLESGRRPLLFNGVEPVIFEPADMYNYNANG